ncbi:MAG: endonuclease/exonuclease/phosphatase family protein [Opitutae bacterium]|nr:endonuclease/exonuclease/phosphatase family protein [Opitutae bacterium]
MSTTRLRLITFNIAHGRGLTPIQGVTSARKIRANLLKIAHLMQELKPDVVALQEIDQCSRWAGNFDHLEFLRHHMRFPHAVFGITNRREGLLNLCYGNAVLSRHPILESESIVFGQRRIGEKGFLYVELDVHGHHVPLINLHLHYRSREHRFRQLDQLMDWLMLKHRAHGPRWRMPPLVCGDFNTPRTNTDATASLHRHLDKYAVYAVHPQHGHTFPSPWPQRALDFIFLPAACHHVREEIVPVMLSDHRPVQVDFTFGH